MALQRQVEQAQPGSGLASRAVAAIHGLDELLALDPGKLTVLPLCQAEVEMGFLQRIVNGGGTVDREYGVGRGRIDLLIRKPCTGHDGEKTVQRIAFELKVWRTGRPDPLPAGLQQLDSYLDRMGLDTGVLAIFDRRTTAPPPSDRVTLTTDHSPAGRDITVLRG
jgi:hypothetical protein